jgi:uncharacterized iron-regulated protein
MRWIRFVAVTALLAGFSGCASTSGALSSRQTPSAEAARGVKLFRGAGGAAATWEELVDEACEADVVFVGELHGHPLGLASAAALFDDLLARAPHAALSMEFLERDEQLHIDDYLGGVTTLEQFERATGRNAGNFPPGHRAMLEAAKRAGRPVHAANAPRRYVSLARREGYERLRGLTLEQRRHLRVPEASIGGRYREDFDRIMTPADEAAREGEPSAELRERLDAVYRSQSVWDWTMAESVARALLAAERPVVHVVGNFHVGHRGGTVQALERQLPGVRVLIVVFVGAWSEELQAEHDGRADFVAYVGPAD